MCNQQAENPMAVVYVILALLVGIGYAIWTPQGQSYGFFARVLIFILAAPCAFVGALIGDFIRKIVVPDAIYTTGRVGAILKAKLFWFIGPQLIGLLIGGSVGSAIVHGIFF